MAEEPKKTTTKQRGRPWEKGKTGNPNGRPKKDFSMTEILREELRGIVTLSTGQRMMKRKAVAFKLIEGALSGDVQALKYIMDRLDGKPDVTQHIVDDTIPPVEIFLDDVIKEQVDG